MVESRRPLQTLLLKQAQADGKIAYFRYTRLIIKERTNRFHPTGATEPSDSGADAPTHASVPGDGTTTGGVAPGEATVPDTAAAAVGGGRPLDDGRVEPGPSTSAGAASSAAGGSGGGVMESDVSEGEMAKRNSRPRRKKYR